MSDSNVRVVMPLVEKVEVRPSGYDDRVEPTITLDWTHMRTFCECLRELAQTFDPQDHDAVIAEARRVTNQGAALERALAAVFQFRGTGGVMLDGALDNLMHISEEVGLWTRSGTTTRG